MRSRRVIKKVLSKPTIFKFLAFVPGYVATLIGGIQAIGYIGLGVVFVIGVTFFLLAEYSDKKVNIDESLKLEDKESRFRTRLLKAGVTDLYYVRDDNQGIERHQLTNSIIQNGNRFALLALTGSSFFDDEQPLSHWTLLKEKLDKGAEFQILLMDPLCKEKKIRDKVNKIEASYDPKFRMDLLLKLYNAYPDKIKIRFTKNCSYCSLFFSEKQMIYDPYHLGQISGTDRLENNFVVMHIIENEGLSYEMFKSHFDHLWNNYRAVDIQAYIADKKNAMVFRNIINKSYENK